MQVEVDLSRSAGRRARAADEPFVAGPLLAARLREERVRRARVRAATAASCRRRGRMRTAGRSANHGGRVTVRYKVYGDLVDGTYLAIDTTHAHINMPAAIMWARGLDDRPSTLTFTPPSGAAWQVATQLHPGSSPLEFTAPNLPYLMDSPVEFGPLVVREFSVGSRTFSFAVHHLGSDADLDDYVKDVEKIVRQEGADLRRVSRFRAGLLHLPRGLPAVRQRRRHGAPQQHGDDLARARFAAAGAACSRRWRTSSSTRGTSSASVRDRSSRSISSARTCRASCGWPRDSRSTTARCRCSAPASPICARRRTRSPISWRRLSSSPGARVRSAEEMSRMASFVDGGTPVDRTNWPTTYISYYPLRRRHRARARSHAARSLGQPRHARRLHAGHVARPRQARRRPRRLRRSPVHVGRRRGAAGGSERRRARSRANFFVAVHSRPRRRRLRDAARTRGVRRSPAQPGTAVVGRLSTRAEGRPV